MRTGNQSNTLLSPANINGDDGNRNFKRGDMIANRVSLLGEAHVKHDNFGALVRGSVFYDWAYSGTNSNNAPGTVNHSGPFNEFTGSAQDYHESRAQLLDAYVYGAVPIESTQLSFKLGNQVVAWGESLFFANIAGAQGPADATKAFVPGAKSRTSCCPCRRPRCSGRSRRIQPDGLLPVHLQAQPDLRAGQLLQHHGRGRAGREFIIGPGSGFRAAPTSRHPTGASGASAGASACSRTPRSACTSCAITTRTPAS